MLWEFENYNKHEEEGLDFGIELIKPVTSLSIKEKEREEWLREASTVSYS